MGSDSLAPRNLPFRRNRRLCRAIGLSLVEDPPRRRAGGVHFDRREQKRVEMHEPLSAESDHVGLGESIGGGWIPTHVVEADVSWGMDEASNRAPTPARTEGPLLEVSAHYGVVQFDQVHLAVVDELVQFDAVRQSRPTGRHRCPAAP